MIDAFDMQEVQRLTDIIGRALLAGVRDEMQAKSRRTLIYMTEQFRRISDFGGYIGDNYIAMAQTGMSLDELATIAEYSLKSSFATPEQKTTYANALADWKRIHL